MKVYCIENTFNSKKYVGITKGKLENRFRAHKLKAKTEQRQHLHDAFNLYGNDFFIIYEIDAANSISELYEKEKYWIKKLDTKNNGYNETDGGEGSHGRIVSEETKRKMSEIMKLRFSNPENRKKTSETTKKGMENWWNSLINIEKETWLENCRKRPEGYIPPKGYKLGPNSNETKNKKRLSQIGRKHPLEEIERGRLNRIGKGTGLNNAMANPIHVDKIRQKALGRKKTLRPDGSWYWTKP